VTCPSDTNLHIEQVDKRGKCVLENVLQV